jgi:hypothetical protein
MVTTMTKLHSTSGLLVSSRVDFPFFVLQRLKSEGLHAPNILVSAISAPRCRHNGCQNKVVTQLRLTDGNSVTLLDHLKPVYAI